MKVVVTGSAGYIGGQTVLQLKEAGHIVIGIDWEEPSRVIADALDETLLQDFASQAALATIGNQRPDAIIHCAGSSLVGPGVENPREYYENNVVKTKRLADTLVHWGMQNTRIIFSSSASVYGIPVMTPCQETDPVLPISPYGESKMMVEMILNNYRNAYNLHSINLRYFNASGADPYGRHGQKSDATHIFPRIMSAINNNTEFNLFGHNLNTKDGTCVRDYVHVSDIADAHVLACDPKVPDGTYNLACENGYSNLDIIKVCEKVTGKKLKVNRTDSRPGDPDVLFANSTTFRECAGWQPKYGLEEIAETVWQWHG